MKGSDLEKWISLVELDIVLITNTNFLGKATGLSKCVLFTAVVSELNIILKE